MTDDRVALVELIEQGADSDLVRDMLAFAAERMAAAKYWASPPALRRQSPSGKPSCVR